MYAKQLLPNGNLHSPFFATLFYTLIYALLWLRHRARKACFHLHHALERFRKSLFKSRPSQSVPYTPSLQKHLAFSGHIASHLEHLAEIIVFVANHGTTHVTLYDHLQHINPSQLAPLIHHRGLHPFQLSQIAIQKTNTYYSTCNHQPMTHQCQLTTHCPPTKPEICLTIVNPGAGRASIARSARLLAERQSETTPVVDPQAVTEWLHADHAQCMLPSEPDTLVVFPSPAASSIPVLNGFPVWQIRLTQIRFSSIPLAHCSPHQLLEMVTSAANAPKRFGR